MRKNNSNNSSMNEFSDLIDAQLQGFRSGFEPGEKVVGVVLDVTGDNMVLDVNAKREGLVDRAELEEDERTFDPGDKIEVWFAGMQDGAFRFTTRLSGEAAVERSLGRAVADDMPVEGVVKSEIKGGYEIDVGGRRAFCPYSQMGFFRKDPEEYLDRRFLFLVAELNEEDRNLVLSRRAWLERERAEQLETLKQSLAEGDMIEGRVTRLVDFGIFVDIGGIEGLVPMSELSWQRGMKPADVAAEGDEVRVVVREIDWDRERVSLSLRDAGGNPWDEAGERFSVGDEVEGRVVRLERFGAFVELAPGLEGLVPISMLGYGRRLAHASEVLTEGAEIPVRIESMDLEARRISLRPVDERLERDRPGELTPGQEVTGIVESITDFGVFLRVSANRTGLLHVRELDIPRGANAKARLGRMFAPGAEIKMVVATFENDKLSLTTPQRWNERESEVNSRQWIKDKSTASQPLGNLGDTFEGLDL